MRWACETIFNLVCILHRIREYLAPALQTKPWRHTIHSGGTRHTGGTVHTDSLVFRHPPVFFEPVPVEGAGGKRATFFFGLTPTVGAARCSVRAVLKAARARLHLQAPRLALPACWAR